MHWSILICNGKTFIINLKIFSDSFSTIMGKTNMLSNQNNDFLCHIQLISIEIQYYVVLFVEICSEMNLIWLKSCISFLERIVRLKREALTWMVHGKGF